MIDGEEQNVASLHRKTKAKHVRGKFEDIFNVKRFNDCGSVGVDYSGYTDDVNVAGALSDPSAVEFFKRIGASDFIIDTLTHGHHSVFNSFRENSSVRCRQRKEDEEPSNVM